MKPSEIQCLELHRSALSELCGVDVRTVQRWEDGEAAPTGSALAVLVAFRRAFSKRDAVARRRLTEELEWIASEGGLLVLLQTALDQIK